MTEKTKRIGFLARGGALSLSLTAELAGRFALRASALPHSPTLCGVKAASAAALVRSDLGQAGGRTQARRREGSALSDVITSCF